MTRPADVPGEGASTTPMNGGAALAHMVAAHGSDVMFGMAGFQLLPFYEGVRARGLQHHLINDERGGAFAADAYARLTGRPGVCDATLGPGATNLATGLVESLNAGTPIVAITGNAHRGHAGKNMTQEARQNEILRPAVKELLRVEDITRIPELVRRAYAVATSGRPGPVILDVPEDISHGTHDFPVSDLWVDRRVTRIPAYRSRPDHQDVAAAAKLIAAAERPILLVGGGVHLAQAYDAMATFVEKHQIPLAYTMSGKGALADTHPCCVGVFGRYDRIANTLIKESDCVIVVGCKLGEVATKRYELPGPQSTVIHLDIDPEELGRWARTEVGMCGDARLGFEDLNAALANETAHDRSDYLRALDVAKGKWRAEAEKRYTAADSPVAVPRLMRALNTTVPDDAIVVADGGFAAHWSALLYDVPTSGRGYLADRGFASIGYGLPGSLGASLAAPDRTVIGLTGDGGLNSSIGELETAARIGATFVLVVFNNAASGYVKALQHAVYGQDMYQSSDLSELDFAQIAQAFGCRGLRVDAPEDLEPTFTEAFGNVGGPTVIDVRITRDPAEMLPALDSRATKIKPGDRPA